MRRIGRTSGTITALRVQKRNPDRANVYLDEEFGFSLARIEAARLKVGQAVTSEDVKALLERDTVQGAYDRALGFLTVRPRSAREVRDNLTKAGVTPEEIQQVMARLEAAGLLGDSEFAQFWVQTREQFRPRSRLALKMELRTKGVDDEVIAAALEGVDEEASALEAARARARRLTTNDITELREKLIPFLSRRGFSYAVADAAVRQLVQERATADTRDGESEEREWEQP